MAKKTSPDKPVDGPFAVSDSMFPEKKPEGKASEIAPAFTDEEVAAIMGEEERKWVAEAETEVPAPPDAPAPPQAPPPPPPDPHQWVTEGEPELAPPEDEPFDAFSVDSGDQSATMGVPAATSYVTEGPPDLSPPADDDGFGVHSVDAAPGRHSVPPPAAAAAPPAPTMAKPTPSMAQPTPSMAKPPPKPVEYSQPPSRAPADSAPSGLVMEYAPESSKPDDEEGDPADISSSAMTYLAIGIVAALVGMAGALVVVLVLTAGGPDPAPAEVSTIPEEVEKAKIPVRRSLKEPPKPNFLEENIKEFEEREAEGELSDGQAPEPPDPTEGTEPPPEPEPEPEPAPDGTVPVPPPEDG